MKRASHLLALGLAILCSGCASVVSVRPLYTPGDIQHPFLDPRIAGDWVVVDFYGTAASGDAEQFVTHQAKIVAPDWGGQYSVEFHSTNDDPKKTEEKETYKYDFHLVPIGGKVYFDAEFSEATRGQSKLSREELSYPLVAPANFLGRLSVEPDFLRVEVLNPDWIDKNVPEAGRERASIDRYTDVVTLTGSTDELRELVLRNAESQAFFPVGYLCRPGKDCAALAIDDVVHRWPNEKEMLEGAVAFWAHRKNYDRALEL
jgi:hypothetical protein